MVTAVPAIIAGLGNPGHEYTETRHNLGFRVLDALAARHRAPFAEDARARGTFAKATLCGRTVWLAKPLTFMNDSGQCIGPLARFHKVPPESVLIVHDDITLPAGTAKLSVGGGDGNHNGLTSLLQHLPNTFARLRVGIGGKRWPQQNLADHVLGKLPPEEQHLFQQQLDTLLQGIELWLQKGTALAQNHFNRRPPPPSARDTSTLSQQQTTQQQPQPTSQPAPPPTRQQQHIP